jgi:hypothetical protein
MMAAAAARGIVAIPIRRAHGWFESGGEEPSGAVSTGEAARRAARMVGSHAAGCGM